MDYVELNVSVSPKQEGSDILITILSEMGFDGFVDSEEGFLAYAPTHNFDERLVSKLLERYTHIFDITYTPKIIPRQNWNKVWEESFNPIDIDGECYIRAPFHEEKKHYNYQLIIEPKMSFGTGHHFTTQLMVKKMLGLILKNKTLLDIGCGTGVLAILASKMGANPITAVDIDEWSIENTVENNTRNDVQNIHVEKGDVKAIQGKKFDIILANINKNVLIADIEKYTNSLNSKGQLIMSGFFETDMHSLKEEAKKCNLIYVHHTVDNTWALLHFTKQ